MAGVFFNGFGRCGREYEPNTYTPNNIYSNSGYQCLIFAVKTSLREIMIMSCSYRPLAFDRDCERENSIVKVDFERDNIAFERDNARHDHCEKKHDHQKVVLNAATGGAGPLPVITTLLAEPISVVSVTLNVNELKHPSILLTFTGAVSLPLGISVNLNFEVERVKDNGSPIKVGSTYTFSTLATALESETFAFQLFDAGLEPGTYTYTVVLSTNSVIDITPGLTIVNATLSALGVDND